MNPGPLALTPRRLDTPWSRHCYIPMERPPLSDTELYRTMETALALAGDFYATLAQAWFLADPENKRRLVEAFPRLIEEYGPGSRLYQGHLRQSQD